MARSAVEPADRTSQEWPVARARALPVGAINLVLGLLHPVFLPWGFP